MTDSCSNGVRVGSVDRITAVIGARGTGKSTWAVADSVAWSRMVGGYSVGHSPSMRLPPVMPDGRPAPLHYHASLKSVDTGLAQDPGSMHVLVSDDPEPLLEHGRMLSRRLIWEALRERGLGKHSQPPTDLCSRPVLVMIDEGVTISHKRDREAQERWIRFLTGARHEHVALTWLIQAPTSRSWSLIEQSSRIVVFRYRHRWGGEALVAGGIPREDLEMIREFETGEHVIYDMRESGPKFRTVVNTGIRV